ncbi:MAG: AAA family ATPase [Caldilineaceae bacterium]
MLKKLPIGIQTFSEIIEDGYLYVDKSESIHRLITSGKYFFLSRPRRSGKSLTLSTIKSIYLGQRDLFSRLYQSAAEAIRQIHDKGYAAKSSADPRPKVLLGINFSSQQKTVEGWLVEVTETA